MISVICVLFGCYSAYFLSFSPFCLAIFPYKAWITECKEGNSAIEEEVKRIELLYVV